ncbi:PSD1 and planctomycete cytochrome C domain-containing protein [Portibacter marinus]|uniref:PSD1 and planctomycete cytochrome C domain-containing protein n=1 Tax=Portibacter marinus TaxID=2898660 RepID=UPI001F395074|nr:PSD1 and planctomycete cytochrome C domain-containing protein [Portibacter marinus]
MKKIATISIISIFLLSGVWWWTHSHQEKIDFNTQVRPILNKNCLACHGGVKQQSGLSFLFIEESFSPAKSGKTAIVPGNVRKSEMIHRITSDDPEIIMPPDKPPLSEKEIETLKLWVRQGAKFDSHWAYKSPKLESENASIDFFVERKLTEEGLSFSEKASRSTLLRRVSLDLTGLPPTYEEAQAFLTDQSDLAYEKLVDRLLQSPHFGEKWAAMWLDLARYADSQGYQKDLLRKEIWRYRDWLIHAFNNDLPFDQFTIEQLAGDLLEAPTDDQILATAFHRNTMTNDEGGTDDEEYRVAAVIDRVNTTFEVWQGTTIACVQCHSHPYDPIRHQEYYELYAYFNNTADADFSSDIPKTLLFSPPQRTHREQLQLELEEIGDSLSIEYQQKMKDFIAVQPGQVQIMKELPPDSSRVTRIFERGNWLAHGDTVFADTPDFLPASQYGRDRLGLAKWLVDGNNPLTSRVIVNRFWEQIFGNGIVYTLEDFGTQGRKPTHPKLLDYLAIKFQDDYQWSVKDLLKEIVMSQTYQQSSKITEEFYKKDRYNYLLARGPRYRLSAEAIRDQALTISGLLNRDVYGPSVMPPQPDGVWNVIRHVGSWQTDQGGDQHRRGIYTFWRRVSPYPSMMTFDVPSREVCVSRRIRTNTPLQAMVTLNDPVFVEAAEHLAVRMREEGGEKIEDQINYGYFLALMKEPDEIKHHELVDLYHKTNGSMELVANVILNLDEVIMMH